MLKIIGWRCRVGGARRRRAAQAQDYPNRPITVVVPYAAGGPVDTVARIVAARMSELLGQQMVIENVGGAGGMTGAARVAKAAPDGYTVLLSGSAVLAQVPQLLRQAAVRSGRRFRARRAVQRFGARADRAQGFPGRTTSRSSSPTPRPTRPRCKYGSAGAGSGSHTCAILLDMRDGHQDHPRAVPRRRSGDAGPDRRPDRLHHGADFDRDAADQGRHGEGLS